MTSERPTLGQLIDRTLIENPDLGFGEVTDIVISAILSDPDPRAILRPIVLDHLELRVQGREYDKRMAAEAAEAAERGELTRGGLELRPAPAEVLKGLHRAETPGGFWDREAAAALEAMKAGRGEPIDEGAQEAEVDAEPMGDSPPADPLAERLTFLRDRVYVNKQRGYVAWGLLTVRDHVSRIVELKRRREGIDTEIRRHRHALRELRAAGKNTLAELYNARVA